MLNFSLVVDIKKVKLLVGTYALFFYAHSFFGSEFCTVSILGGQSIIFFIIYRYRKSEFFGCYV